MSQLTVKWVSVLLGRTSRLGLPVDHHDTLQTAKQTSFYFGHGEAGPFNYIIPAMASTCGKRLLIVLGLTCTQARDVCSQRRPPSSSRYVMMGPGGPQAGPLRLGVAQAAYTILCIRWSGPPDSEQVSCTSYICFHCHERGNLKFNNSSFKFQVLPVTRSMLHHPRPGQFLQ